MVKFNAKTYKKTLFKSTTIQGCKKIPVLSGNEPYIFISYSHKDYKQVYADLSDLHESGIRFWYDTDQLAGINWDDGVRKRLTDPKCRGIIFYLSDNSLRSEAILTEIRIAIGEDSATSCLPKNLDYFAVNLTSDLPSVLVNRIFDGTDNGNERKRILEKAFPDEQIFLIHEDGKNKKKNYWPKLIQNIMLRFNIYPENDPYKLRSSGAELISGHAVIHYSDGATYDGAFVNNRLHHHGTLRFPDGSGRGKKPWRIDLCKEEPIMTHKDAARVLRHWGLEGESLRDVLVESTGAQRENLAEVGAKYFLKRTAEPKKLENNLVLTRALAELGLLSPVSVPTLEGEEYLQEGAYCYTLLHNLYRNSTRRSHIIEAVDPVRHPDPPAMGLVRLFRQVPAGAGVNIGTVGPVRGVDAVELAAGAEAGVQQPFVHELFKIAVINGASLALGRLLVIPAKAQPAQVIPQNGGKFITGALGVQVLHPQQNVTVPGFHRQPGDQKGKYIAQVHPTGRCGRKPAHRWHIHTPTSF